MPSANSLFQAELPHLEGILAVRANLADPSAAQASAPGRAPPVPPPAASGG